MAINSNALAGTAYLTVDGQQYLLAGNLKYRVTGYTRESLSGMDSVHGFSEKVRPGYIECDIRDSGGLSMAAINAMRDVTVVAELANGKTIVARNAWSVEDQDVDTAEATSTVRWESVSVTEQ